VVVTHGSAATIADTIASLAALSLEQVVVVDNDSPDETVTVVREVLPDHGVLVQGPNVGFGAGNNRGVAAPTRPWDVVLFLNPDATLAPGDFTAMLAYLDAHPTVGMVGGAIWRAGIALPSGGREASVLTEWRRELPRVVGRWLPDRPLPAGELRTGDVTYVEGACMLARRSAFDAVGGFDEEFFLFFEEIDIARRMRAAGWQVHLVADARVQHLVAASRSGTRFSGEPHFAASTYRYLRTHRSRLAATVWFAGMRVLWALRSAVGRMDAADRRARVAAVRQMTARMS
jgi:N-acetylglucosaminyl-diphospho-decaprenol L-rhamnosyltransferase